ncbi:unnamed protein product [Calicophoron daubneyi]|uniref:Uncharacterized protein n=1 Tax=Calicophoron daubneyi TaxID=300641 RepID=A0AAV2TDR0_CALDB
MEKGLKPNESHSREAERGENKGVVFAKDAEGEKSKRKRYLTAKYDRKTRHKITEKIRVENFMFEGLRKLYHTDVDDYDCDIDLDEVRNITSDADKKTYLKEKLINCPATCDEVTQFIDNILKQLR